MDGAYVAKEDAVEQADRCLSYSRAGAAHMWAMMLSPNSLHLISVAPSIWRAKS